MKPKHKFNNGRGAILCQKCNVIISEGLTNQVLCGRCLQDLVYNYPTKSPYGLLDEEIKQLVTDNFKEFNWDKYYDAMMGNTCMTYEGKIVNYHCDVITGIKCGIENRNIHFSEFD